MNSFVTTPPPFDLKPQIYGADYRKKRGRYCEPLHVGCPLRPGLKTIDFAQRFNEIHYAAVMFFTHQKHSANIIEERNANIVP